MENETSQSSDINVFLHRFFKVAAFGSFLILLFSGFATFHLYERFVIRQAQTNAVNIAAAMLSIHREQLGAALRDAPLLPPQLLSLHKVAKSFMHPYEVLKVKLYSPDTTVVYSSDFSIIGKQAGSNQRLQAALSGSVSSKMITKEKIKDLVNKELHDVSIIESYIPMYTSTGEIEGVFELYQDVTRYNAILAKEVGYLIVGLAAILFFVFFGAFIFMFKTAQTLLKHQNELQHMAMFDALTQLYNRAEISRRMEQEWERYKRNAASSKPFGIMMLDLDHFKSVNDTYGHQVGDELLRAVSARLLSELRSYSLIGRYGGEEFIILLPEINIISLDKTAHRILKLLSDKPYEIGGVSLHATTSIGTAVVTRFDKNIDAVIKRADDHLYEAKGLGRNRVIGC